MTNERGNPSHPPVVTQAAYQSELDKLRAREKAHTREGDAIAAARRRLPMVEVDASLPLTGPDGPLTLLDAFEGRRQLIAYYFMWYDGYPADRQCEGCTWCASPASCTWSATCATAARSTRPTGPPAAASSSWTTAWP
jgi:predicted dithiol-disulfide oxidoreductase (DUF899 family)